MRSWLLRQFGGVPESSARAAARSEASKAVHETERRIRGKYDAAQTTTDNARHWAMADHFSASTSNWLAVRKRLRERARLECSNNGYARGIVNTLANDAIGTGPRLQIRGQNRAAGQKIEQLFAAWCRRIRLPEKLRLMRTAKAQDGESFAKFFTNPRVPGEVSLDIEIIEADRVQAWATTSSFLDDSIEYDDHGNPLLYRILRYHPGDLGVMKDRSKRDEIAAEFVIHVFRMERPGQLRGIPEITPALPLFAKLRAYTLSVVEAAATAANYTAVLATTQSADDGPTAEPMDTVEIERGMLTVLPDGYDLRPFKAEQPTTSYAQFKSEIIMEIARCLNMPFNVAAGNSSGYNYSSGRLDVQIYGKAILIERDYFESQVLGRIFSAWYDEASLIPNYLPPLDKAGLPLRHIWIWDALQSIDPVKDATAAIMLLETGMKTAQEYEAEQGGDWEEMMDQVAVEEAARKARGLPSILVTDKVLPKSDPSAQPAGNPKRKPAPEETANAA
jgi:lambda family phage portal protein